MPILDTDVAATEKQLAYLRALATERDWHDRLNGEEWETAWDVQGKERFTSKREASAAIGALLKCPRQRVSVAAQATLANKVRAALYDDGVRTLTGPEAAAVRFSREYRVCCVCSSPLSDETSVRLGIGPVCRRRFAG